MLQDIERFNEWGFTGKVRNELALPLHRTAFSRIQQSLNERQILITTGLRRVGKTTLLYQAINELLKTVPQNRSWNTSRKKSGKHP